MLRRSNWVSAERNSQLNVNGFFNPPRQRVTLGAQGLVYDASERVLLIRHTYRPGWHFPGGGVERNETVELALSRELDEEAGIHLAGAPSLFGVYTHFDIFPGDHVALYLVEAWTQPRVPKPNNEIAEQGFFHWRSVPDDTNPRTRMRLREVFGGVGRAEAW